jgi:adenine-specific DNA-methyltransferase
MTTNNESLFEKKKRQYHERIDLIAKESFNNEQKEIAKQIIDAADENNIDAVYQLVTQRVKTGFVFDAAPEVNHNCVALAKENPDLLISGEKSGNEHLLIIGENYDALMNLLVTYIDPLTGKGLIDIVYIDPPYNTEKAKQEGNDHKERVEGSKFIYRDKFTRDGWMNLMNERLNLTRKLLKDDGLIFISIDDNELCYLKILCDEIFGENNFISSLPRITKKSGKTTDEIAKNHDYLLVYAKNSQLSELSKLKFEREEETDDYYELRGGYRLNQCLDYNTLQYSPSLDYEINLNGKTFYPGGDIEKWIERKNGKYNKYDWAWRWSKALFDFAYANDFIVIKNNTRIYTKTYSNCSLEFNKEKNQYEIVYDEALKPYDSLYFTNNEFSNDNSKKELDKFCLGIDFKHPKSSCLIKEIIKLKKGKHDTVILDFFAGSGTTGQAVMELNEEDGENRKCILVTNNENDIALKVTRERLFRVINGKGTNGETIKWKYSLTNPYLSQNTFRVFEIEYHELNLNDFEKAKKLIPIAEEQFKKLNPNYKAKDRFDIYNDLAALNPYKKV